MLTWFQVGYLDKHTDMFRMAHYETLRDRTILKEYQAGLLAGLEEDGDGPVVTSGNSQR